MDATAQRFFVRTKGNKPKGNMMDREQVTTQMRTLYAKAKTEFQSYLNHQTLTGVPELKKL